MGQSEFQQQILLELHEINKTLKAIASSQERNNKITVIPHSMKNPQL